MVGGICGKMVSRSKLALKMLPYVAGAIFVGMWIQAMDVSSELSMMADTGFNLYHDPIDVEVFWFESRACMMLPPDGYLTNCVYVASISAILGLTVLLARRSCSVHGTQETRWTCEL